MTYMGVAEKCGKQEKYWGHISAVIRKQAE